MHLTNVWACHTGCSHMFANATIEGHITTNLRTRESVECVHMYSTWCMAVCEVCILVKWC